MTSREISVGGLWGGEDRWHRPVGGAPAYRESYYFDFADEQSDLVGFTSVGWKPHRGVLGATTVLFDDDGAWISQAQRATDGDFPLLAVQGLSYRQAGDAFGAWDVKFVGPMVPTEELGTAARRHVGAAARDVHLLFAYRARAPEVCSAGTDFAHAFSWHLDQPGDTQGWLDRGPGVARQTFSGRGHRDRSFGKRDWTHFNSWAYLVGHTADVAINFWALQSPDGTWAVTGWIQHTGRAPEIIESIRFAPGDMLEVGDDRIPAILAFELTSASGPVTGTAESARLIPLGFTTRRGSSRLDRGIGNYVINGQPGSGQVEYQQRLDPTSIHSRWRLEDR